MADAAKQKIVRPEGCICVQFRDTGGFRIADLTCPVHGVDGGSPGDGYWETEDDAGQEGHVTTPPPVPPQAIKAAYAAYQKAWLTHNQDNPLFAEKVVREVVEAAAPHLAAAERERCADQAIDLKFTLWRPRNGPGAGQQAIDVVPLTELLHLLRKDPHAAT